MIALVISILLWTSLSLSEETTRIVEVTLVSHSPEGFTFSSEIPERFTYVHKGSGYDFLKLDKKPIIENFFKDTQDVILDALLIESLLQEDLGLNAENIVRINFPNTLISFDSLAQKQLPISTSRLHFTLLSGLVMKEDIILEPDSIVLSGPNKVLQNLDLNQYFPLDTSLGTIVENFRAAVRMKPVSLPGVTIKPESVQLAILVEKGIEKKLEIPLKLINPSNIHADISPSFVSLRTIVGISRYELVRETDFTLQIDFSRIKNGKAPVELAKYPSFLENISFSPDSVNVIIFKK